MILNKHYNNVKALHALNQELFQMRMADKETALDWGVCLSRYFQILAASFPNCFPPDCVAELVWSSGTDITLDDVLMILNEHYNNVKALHTLNQELFQMRMADKETVSDWGVCLSRYLQILAAYFPDCFPPDHVAELKRDHFYGGLSK